MAIKNRVFRLTSLLAVLLMLLGLCACSSRPSQNSGMKEPAPTPMPYASNAAYEVAADYYVDGEAGLAAYAVAGEGNRSEAQDEETPEMNPDKIIYSSDVTVETTRFDETVGEVDSLVKSYSAWIESSSISGSNYYQKARGNANLRSASYTLRVPSERFSALMESLSELGNIPYSHIYTENVTSRYYDVSARLTAYRTQEARLLEMMELAETVEDVIIIEDRLTELRYEIESLQSTLNSWDRRVAYSTVSLSIQEVREYTPEEPVNPSFGEELVKAMKDGLANAGDFLKGLLLLLAELLPLLIILIPLLWLLIRLVKRLLKNRKGGRKLFGRKKKEEIIQEQHTEDHP